MGWPLLSLTIFLPMAGVVFLLLLQSDPQTEARNARWIALWTSLLTLGLSIIVLGWFNRSDPGFQLVESFQWVKEFGLAYRVGVDGISVMFVLLSAVLTPICIVASWESIEHRVKDYMIAFLVLETMMIGMFCALDMILFYLFFEGTLIPMFIIIGVWGGPRRVYAAFKFFLYTLLGSVLMFLAILNLYYITGTMNIMLLLDSNIAPELQTWLWLAFFASFAVKVPMWPVHTWLPDAHVEAPTAGSVILAGVLLKMGGYGFIRFSIPIFPDASIAFAPFVFILSIVAIIYTSLIALAQEDMKKLIAYSSVAHMGFVTIGLFSLTQEGISGALFQMISHGLVSGALFLCVGVLYDRVHTRDIARYGGLVENMPRYAVVFMLMTLASVGLPGTSGFVGEFLVLSGVYTVSNTVAILATTGIILGAAYMLYLYRRVIFGQLSKPELLNIGDLSPREIFVFVPLIISVVWLGIHPQVILDIFFSSVEHLLQRSPNFISNSNLLTVPAELPNFSR